MKKILTGVGIILALCLSTYAVINTNHSSTSVVSNTQDVTGKSTSPELSSPYFCFGGICNWNVGTTNLIAASTTGMVCSVQTPNATTTLEEGSGIRFSVSSSTATTVQVGVSSSPSSLGTFLFGASIAANAQATVVATTTGNSFVIAPLQYVNFQLVGGTGTFSPQGNCETWFMQI